MRISIFGSGYVGLVSAVGFAELGNEVVCVDVDDTRIEALKGGHCPIYEPGLEPLLAKNREEKRIFFTTDASVAVGHGEVIFIAVGTPPEEDGSADLQYVIQVAKTIAQMMTDYTVVVNKSTVPVGTVDLVRQTIADILKQRGKDIAFDVLSNPEFLKEGTAVTDFMRPDRIVIGTESDRAIELMQQLYRPINRHHDKLMVMDPRSAEMTKMAANAMLATKISFMNEMSRMADYLDVDIEQVRLGIGMDARIGYSFIYPGCGYGGSCFPKDIRSLTYIAKQAGYKPRILDAVHDTNERQKEVLAEKVLAYFNGDVKGKTFALWGLSFKPGTDDMREASSRVIIKNLLAAGAQVVAYDPQAREEARKIYHDQHGVCIVDDLKETILDADALIIATEWMVFRSPDFLLLKAQLKTPVIFDGRNLFDPKFLKRQGFDYIAIGRGNVKSDAFLLQAQKKKHKIEV